MTKYLKLFLISFFVYFGSWFVFGYLLNFNALHIQSEDTVPTMILPVAIIRDKTIYLDSFYDFMINKYPHPDDKDYQKGLVPFYLRRVSGHSVIKSLSYGGDGPVKLVSVEEHYVTAFPLITGLLALPIYYFPIKYGLNVTWDSLIMLSHISSAVIMAFSVCCFYMLSLRFFLNEKKSQLLTAIYAFGTINYALLSQALWQHGTVQLFLILSLYYVLLLSENLTNEVETHKEEIKKNALLLGLFLSLAILSRPTAVATLPFIYLILFVKTQNLKSPDYKSFITLLIKSLLGFIPSVLFFLWYNYNYYFSLSNQGYADQAGTGWLGRFPEGFLGLWLSPSKGILVYSPVFLFIFVSLYLIYKRRTLKKDIVYISSFLIVIVHTLVLGKWKHWYGGWSYGYRMASDILPFLTLLLVPFLQSEFFSKYKKLFFALVIASILVELHGIVFFDGIWHAAYDDGFVNTSWLWSLQNSEFAFNIRRVLVKLSILERACPNCLPN